MKSDAGAVRLLTAVENLRNSNKLLELFATQQNCGSYGLTNFSNYYTTAPICAGYFNVSSPLSSSCIHTEELSFPESVAFLLYRIVILPKDETLLNGSVVGHTTPNPASCGLKIWASNLVEPLGRFVPLSLTSGPPGTIYFVPDIRELATDRLVIQGQYDTITICVFGWPLDVSADIRLTAGKRYYKHGFSSRIGRGPFVETYTEICPNDAVDFEKSLSHQSLKHELQENVSLNRVIHHNEENVMETHPLKHYFDTLRQTELHHMLNHFFVTSDSSVLHSESNDTLIHSNIDENPSNITINHNKTIQHCPKILRSVPHIQYIQQIGCCILQYMKELDAIINELCILYSGVTQDEYALLCRELIVLCPLWRQLFHLLLWPFETYQTYSRYVAYITETILPDSNIIKTLTKFDIPYDILQQRQNQQMIEKESIIDPSSGSYDQQILCLKILTSIIQESTFGLHLFLFFNGHWAALRLSDIEGQHVVPFPIPNIALTPELPIVLSLPNRPTFRVKTAAFQLLFACSSHRHGIIHLIQNPLSTHSEDTTDHKESNHPHQDCVESDTYPSLSQSVIDTAEDSHHNIGQESSIDHIESVNNSQDFDTRLLEEDTSIQQDSSRVSAGKSIYEIIILEAISQRKFGRIRYRSILLQFLHQIRLHVVINGFLTAAELIVTETVITRHHLIEFLEVLTTVVALSQWNILRQQELDEIGIGSSGSLNSRLSRLTQIGSHYGERNDGYGPDNHFCFLNQSNSIMIDRLFKLIFGTQFIELLLLSLNRLKNTRLDLQDMYGFYIDIPQPTDLKLVTDTTTNPMKHIFTRVTHGYSTTTPQYESIPLLQLLISSELFCLQLLEWILSSSKGISSFILHYTCCRSPCQKMKQLITLCITQQMKTNTQLYCKCHPNHHIISVLPLHLQHNILQHIIAYYFVARLHDPTILTEILPHYQLINNHCSGHSILSASNKRSRIPTALSYTNYSNRRVVSLQHLRDLSLFASDIDHSIALLRVWGDDLSFPYYLSLVLTQCLQLQLTLETDQLNGTLLQEHSTTLLSNDIILEQNQSEESSTIHYVYQMAATISCLKWVIHIIWSLCRTNDSIDFITIISQTCFDAFLSLSQIIHHCNIDSNELIGTKSCIPLRDEPPRELFLSGLGNVDISFDAYGNMGSSTTSLEDGKGGLSMLKCLVPASLFTPLRQVYAGDQVLYWETIDLLSLVQLMHRSTTSLTGQHPMSHTTPHDFSHCQHSVDSVDLFTTSTTKDPSSFLLQQQGTDHFTKDKELLFPSTASRIDLLISALKSLSLSCSPNTLVPISESAQLGSTTGTTTTGTTTQAPSSSSICIKLGGYSGALFVPLFELDTHTSTPLLLNETTNNITDSFNHHVIDPLLPPKMINGWNSQCQLCLSMILKELSIHSSLRSQVEMTETLSVDELALSLQLFTFDSPHLAIQNNYDTLRTSLTHLLNFSSSLISPPLMLGQTGYVTQCLEGSDAYSWEQALIRILPITEMNLKVLFHLLHVILPTAPFPVSPGLNLRHRTSYPISRCSSTTGSLWIPGNLIDSSLIDTLIVLLTKLTHAWIFINQNYLNTTCDSSKNNKQHLLITITYCLDLTAAILRLWIIRCPDASAYIIGAAIKQSRIYPAAFIVGPLLIACLGGIGIILPIGGATILLSNQQPPLMATELNGAEGRNLEAVVMRLKQLYLQRRHTDSMRTGIGIGSGTINITGGGPSRLPASMTTLSISSRCRLPPAVEEALFGIGVTHFLVFQIPLAPPALPPNPTGSSTLPLSSHSVPCGPAGYSWIRRRLGRISMGHDNDVLSFCIFRPDGFTPITTTHGNTLRNQTPSTAGTTTTTQSDTISAEWAGYDRLRDLLYDSLEDDAIEIAFESDRVPVVPLGLSPANITGLTESRGLPKEMMRRLNEETIGDDKSQLVRLEKLSRSFKYIKIEDLAELFNLLVMSAYTTNNFLHSTIAHSVCTLSWTNGLPALDVILHVAHSAVQHLSSFLARELASRRSVAISQLFLITRLFLFTEHVFSLFPYPTLEAATCLIRFSTEGLRALQDVPVIDPSCPTYPVLMGLFDCLLPAVVRVLSAGVTAFNRFVNLLKSPINTQLEAGLTPLQMISGNGGVLPNSVSGTGSMIPRQRMACRFENSMLSNQFRTTLRKPGSSVCSTTSVGQSRTVITTTSQAAPDLISSVLSSIRLSCNGLCAILNQLPVAWDILSRSTVGLNPLTSPDVSKDWTGLSVSVIIGIVSVLQQMTSTKFFCAVSLFDVPDSFLETYLDAIHFSENIHPVGTKLPTPVIPNTPNNQTTASTIAVAGTPDPTIKLEAFISTVTDAVADFASSGLPALIKDSNESISRYTALLTVVRDLIALTSSVLTRCGFRSASLLLPLATSDPAIIASLSQPLDAQVVGDEAAQLYADIDPNGNQCHYLSDVPSSESIKLSPNTLREEFLLGLLQSLETISATLKDDNVTPSIKHTFRSIDSRIEELKAIRRFVMEDLIHEHPPLILRASELIDLSISTSQTHIEAIIPTLLDTRETPAFSLNPFTPGLPISYPMTFSDSHRGQISATSVLSIARLALQMNEDSLWRNSVILDAIDIQPPADTSSTDTTVPDHIDGGGTNGYLCLADVVRAHYADEPLPKNGSLIAYFEELRQTRQAQRPSSSLPQTVDRGSYWRSSSTVPSVPLRGSASGQDSVSNDPFRARRGPSSRAPSKHVDEFEAKNLQHHSYHHQQQPKTVTNLEASGSSFNSSTVPNGDSNSSLSAEQSLDTIPQWREFVASGTEQGLDVMSILKAPHLLQDPHIEHRFRSLVELHPSIKTLFKMMELDI